MKRDANRISSFFIEIILVIGFFSISASATLQLFMMAGNRAQQSSDLSVAVIKAQNIAEQVKGLSSGEEVPQALRSAKRADSGDTVHFLIDYDKQWNQTQGEPCYRIDVALIKKETKSGVMLDADIAVFRCKSGGENQIFKLDTAKYLPKTL